jgi:phage gp36-like protein
MAFLTPTDYGLQIRQELRDIVTDGSTTLLEDAGLAAQVEMESYLRGRYDLEKIFAALGPVAAVPATDTEPAMPAQPDQRNRQVVMYLVDMALYHLHSRQNPRNVPQIRQDRYDHAISWLKMARKGELSVGLPDLPATDADGNPNPGSILPRGGSLPKQRNTY